MVSSERLTMTYLLGSKTSFFVLLVSFFVLLVGCESGDSSRLSQQVRLADLEIESIEVSPATGALKTGYSYQYVATGVKADGVRIDITDLVEWSVSDSAIATVSKDGLVKAVADGGVNITASLSLLSAVASLTTSSAALQGLILSADDSTPDACGNTQLKVIGDYGSGDVRDTMPITDFVTWNIAIDTGSVNATGYLRIFTNFPFNVSVASVVGEAAVTGTTPGNDLSINVVDNLNSPISVTPANSTININETLQYTATGTYDIGGTLENRNITQNVKWSSDQPGVAAFESTTKGLVTAKQGSVAAVNIAAACGTDTNQNTTLTVIDDTFLGVQIRNYSDNTVIIDNIVLTVGQAFDIALYATYSNASLNANVSNTTDFDTVWNIQSGTTGIIEYQVFADFVRVTAKGLGNDSMRGAYNGADDIVSFTVQ